ncbi:MAG: low molecular weight protein-tyrosine-phosphatase [Halioglobus sp.]
MSTRPIRVLFVCLGNICRSPTVEGVFTAFVKQQGMAGEIEIDSCGTSDWHVGSPPDARAIRAAASRGYTIAQLRARQIRISDFDECDFILAMDRDNLLELKTVCPPHYQGYMGLFLQIAPDLGRDELPDPYYGNEHAFEQVLDLAEAASEKLLALVLRRRGWGSGSPPK